MQIIEKNIKDLIPYEKNPRRNDEAVKYVAASIKQFGFKVPIVIDTNNVIVAGHTRYKASKKLKLETVPCIIADDLTDQQIKAYRLADNKVAEHAEWDFDLLNGELVLDSFGGSGSTLMTCEQLNRRCAMMELDPHYVDVIIDRWESFTGKKAKKIKS